MILAHVDRVLNTRNVMVSRVISRITNNFVTVYRQANKVCITPGGRYFSTCLAIEPDCD